jgi:hypothetical protein
MKTNTITDDSCGFHVHISQKTKNPIDSLKLIFFVEEERIYKEFQSRIGNTYAHRIKHGHAKAFRLSKEDIDEIANHQVKQDKTSFEKYLGVRFVDLEENHVEFRYMGGANYHTKFKEIRKLIANYAY